MKDTWEDFRGEGAQFRVTCADGKNQRGMLVAMTDGTAKYAIVRWTGAGPSVFAASDDGEVWDNLGWYDRVVDETDAVPIRDPDDPRVPSGAEYVRSYRWR